MTRDGIDNKIIVPNRPLFFCYVLQRLCMLSIIRSLHDGWCHSLFNF